MSNTGEDEHSDHEDEMFDFVPRTLREHNVPRAGDVRGAIRLPRVAGPMPNLAPAVINIVQQNTFHGLDHEDPHEHLQTFLECCTTIKTTEATVDYIRLALFPFTLRDRAKKWLGSLPRESITTWRELSKSFLTRFFPHKRTAKVRTQLTSFRQKFDEPLNEAWERFRELQYSCPHHGIPDWLLIQTFYDGLTESTRTSVDAVAGGALMEREPQEAMNLIDNMAQNQQWSGRESSRTTGGGRLEVDQITALTAKLDAMQKAFDKMSVKAVDNHQPQPCVMCGDKGHSYERCPLAQRDEDTEQVNYLHNESSHFQRPPFNNASSSSNNRNFYNNAAFNNSNNQASQFGPPKPYIAPAVSNFMHEQGKMNQMIFEKLEGIDAQLAGLAAQNKAKEQMGYQTASNQQQPSKLPSQPEVNPRGEVMAITLRSGTHYAPPTMQPADHTDRADSTRTVQNSPDAETEHPHRAESTRPAQPVQTSTDTDRISVTQPVYNSTEGQKTKQAGKPPPYRSPVPFPRRLAESKLNEQFANFIQVLKQLHITIPFTDALTQIPTYAKFLKDILTNKRSLGGRETVKLTE